MFNTTCNEKGISLVEVVIALFLLSLGIMAFISLQPSAWRLSARSDYLGRAAGILHQQLETAELQIMNPNNQIPASGTQTVRASGQGAGVSGDAIFTVNRTVADLGSGRWRVVVNVTWPTNPGGIRESMIVTRQEYFKQ